MWNNIIWDTGHQAARDSDLWDLRNQWVQHYHFPKLLLRKNDQAMPWVLRTRRRPVVSMGWGDRVESSGRPKWLSEEFTEQGTGEMRAVQRKSSRDLHGVPPKSSAKYWSVHLCEEMARGWGRKEANEYRGKSERIRGNKPQRSHRAIDTSCSH